MNKIKKKIVIIHSNIGNCQYLYIHNKFKFIHNRY